jgi:hypothetical protein
MKSLPVIHRFPAITRLQRRSLALPLLSACLLLLAAPAAHGQITNVDDTTSTPIEGAGHDYIKAMGETVNPANGSLSVRIQLPIPKGRGITPTFSIGYDSNSANHIEPGATLGTAIWASNETNPVGGWSFSVPSVNYSQSEITLPTGEYDDNGNPTTYTCDVASNYMFTDLSGSQHALNIGTEYGPYTACEGNFGQGGDPQVGA